MYLFVIVSQFYSFNLLELIRKITQIIFIRLYNNINNFNGVFISCHTFLLATSIENQLENNYLAEL